MSHPLNDYKSAGRKRGAHDHHNVYWEISQRWKQGSLWFYFTPKGGRPSTTQYIRKKICWMLPYWQAERISENGRSNIFLSRKSSSSKNENRVKQSVSEIIGRGDERLIILFNSCSSKMDRKGKRVSKVLASRAEGKCRQAVGKFREDLRWTKKDSVS